MGSPALQALVDRAAGQQLHDDERAGRVAGGLADVVDRHDVGVVADARGGTGLAGEALAGGVVGGQRGGEDLDRHLAPEDLVGRGVHGSHPAVGDVAQHPVALGQGGLELRGRHPCRRRYPRRTAATLLRAMAKVCHSCGKGPSFGNSRSHSMVATKRRFDPNLQKVRALVSGAPKRVYVCTRCLKAGKIVKAV